MRYKFIWSGIAMLLLIQISKGQNKVEPILPGGKVPDLNIQYYLGNTLYKSKLSDYHGKLIIIDFWSVTCTSCLIAMEDIFQLQEQFADKVQFLLVTADSITKVQRFFNRIRRKTVIPKWLQSAQRLPIIYGDSLLGQLFPHHVFPTHVWIDSTGYLISSSYSSSTTKENISLFLEGKKVNLDSQKIIDLKIQDPISWVSQIKDIPFYSLFFKGLEYGMGYSKNYSFSYDSSYHAESGMAGLNLSIIDLYKLAYKDWRPTLLNEIPANRIHIVTKDSSKYFPPGGNEQQLYQWFLDHSYCFALKLAPERHSELLISARSALDNYLSIASRVDSVNVLCYVLKLKPGVSLPSDSKGQALYEHKPGHLLLKNANKDYLNFYFEYITRVKLDNIPFIDETGLSDQINLEIVWEENSLTNRYSSLITALGKKGLLLTKEYRRIPMLVLQDK